MAASLPFTPGRCAELQVHITEVMATAAEQRELIARLEQDLSTIQSIQRPDAEVSPPVPWFCHLPSVLEHSALWPGPPHVAGGSQFETSPGK
jgi:hypothetical protein